MIVDKDLITVNDFHSYLKEMFKDALQEMLEAELGCTITIFQISY